jgi:WD40 repeat protein
VVVTPDGRCAVSASDDQTLRVWDLVNGQTLQVLEGNTWGFDALAVTSDGCRVVSVGFEQKTVQVFDLERGESLPTLEGHSEFVTAVAITPDGCRVVSASRDQTLRVWDVESGENISSFTGEYDMLWCDLTPGGQTIIAGDASGRVHFLRFIEPDETKPAIGDTKMPLMHQE